MFDWVLNAPLYMICVHDRVALFIINTFNVFIEFSTGEVFVKFVIWRKRYFMFVLVKREF